MNSAVSFCAFLKINKTQKKFLTNQAKFRLNKICKINGYFDSEINQKKLCSNKLSKHVPAFYYID